MPISGDQYSDPNTQRFSLPMDSCVGDAGPSPTEVTTISKSGPSPSGTGGIRIVGGPASAMAARGVSK